MKRSSQPVLLLLVLMLASAAHAASTDAVVRGVVQDAHGAPRMGALVQVLSSDATAVAMAITDLNGRYRIHGIAPGRYQMRASAALYLPALRQNLHLGAGVQATVNLTLNALYDTTGWLPARRRAPDAPSDDWVWTLRSAENRPVLRIFDEESTSEAGQRYPIRRSAAVSTGGGFGHGGMHSIVVAERGGESSAAIVRADLGVPRNRGSLESSMDAGVGYERSLGFAGTARMVALFQNHPELQSGGVAGDRSGIQSLALLNAQRMQFGDTVSVEVGSLLNAARSTGTDSQTAIAARPFVNVTAQPVPGLLIAYRMATARELQSISDMDSLRGAMPVTVLSGGQLQTEQGRHQEISVTRKTGQGRVEAAIYEDDFSAPVLSGVGAPLPGADGVLTDPSTGSFRMLGPAYRERGISVSVAEPITQAVWFSGEYSTGDALTPAGPAPSLNAVAAQLHSQWSQAGMVAVEGNLVNTGTNLRMSYRWQPRSTVSTVNAYDAASDRAYLNLYLRQPLRCRQLPDGFEVVLDVSNLLAQGYSPVAVSADGAMVYLAQEARTMQGGLAFTF